MEVALEIVVRCTEIDVNGHVNNAKFVEYLEWGREEWYDRQGLAHGRLIEMGASWLRRVVGVKRKGARAKRTSASRTHS